MSQDPYFLWEAKTGSAQDIYESIRSALHAFAPVTDDVTIAVIKKL